MVGVCVSDRREHGARTLHNALALSNWWGAPHPVHAPRNASEHIAAHPSIPSIKLSGTPFLVAQNSDMRRDIL